MHDSGPFIATFLAATVEWVEAFTIVLAVAVSTTWRLAAGAAFSALAALALLTSIVGRTLTLAGDLTGLRLVIGALLILFGLRWLAKAIARQAGLRALHDEAREFEETRERLDHAERKAAWLIAFKGVFIEGVEVWLLVVTLSYAGGHTDLLVGASLLALVGVVTAGLLLHAPLTRVPENTLKFMVGGMILSFGTFWMGDAIGGKNAWGIGDGALPLLMAFYIGGGMLIARTLRRAPSRVETRA